jgi:thiamine phosphate synthase YjbQ (UPF0047 family)
MKMTGDHVHTGDGRAFDITADCARFAAEASGGGDGLPVPHATCELVFMELGSGSREDLLAALDRLLPRDAASPTATPDRPRRRSPDPPLA